MRQYEKSEVTDIFDLRIRKSCLIYKEFYLQLGVIHIDGILRCFNSIVFVCSMHLYQFMTVIVSQISKSMVIYTPLLERRKCWGKTILPRAGYRLGTYRTMDIFNFSHFCWPILEKKLFLCYYIIKSIARKGYFGPKYP